jgi:hypothetical protein
MKSRYPSRSKSRTGSSFALTTAKGYSSAHRRSINCLAAVSVSFGDALPKPIPTAHDLYDIIQAKFLVLVGKLGLKFPDDGLFINRQDHDLVIE